MEIKRLNKPFGEVALQKNFITLKQLLRALNIQRLDQSEKSNYRLIGAILYEQGAINMDQYNEVLNHCWFTRVNEPS